MSVSILIATYGNSEWQTMAEERALPSTVGQVGVENVFTYHDPGTSVARARNTAAAWAGTDWLCFLDADDELAPGYIQRMMLAASCLHADRSGPCLLVPKVSYVRKGRPSPPKYWREVPLSQGNWLVIGTLIPRHLFMEVGGFREWPVYEDWDLFARIEKAGASIVKVPDALYLAHQSPGGRNKSLTRDERVRVHYDIGRDIWPDLYPESWLHQHLRNGR